MKKIFTLGIGIICLFLTGRSFAQTTCSSVTTTGTALNYHSNPASQTIANGTTGTYNSTIFYYSLPPSAIPFYFSLQQTGSGNPGTSLTPTITIKWGSGGVNSFTCSPGGVFSITSTGTNYYFSITPSTSLPAHTNFQITVAFQNTGSKPATISNFGMDKNAVSNAGSALPVDFSGLTAKSTGNRVNLSWTVESESNVASYQVERSPNASSFDNIGSVTASNKGIYFFTDEHPLQSLSYYRIKSVDIDGRFLYSVISVLNDGRSTVVLRAFPTLVQNQLTVQHDAAIVGTRITISAEDGRLIQTAIPVAGSQQTMLNLSAAKSGLYLIRFENGNGDVQTMKVIKQ